MAKYTMQEMNDLNNEGKTLLYPRVEKYIHLMMRVSRYLQRRMPWLKRRERE